MQPRSPLYFSCALLLAMSFPAWAQTDGGPGSMESDPELMAQLYASMGNPASAARLSDSDASCEQLYAESEYLQSRMAAMPKAVDPMEMSARMQEDILNAQKKAMGGVRAKSMASSLLGMVPGVGGIAGSLASSAMGRGDGGMGAMSDATQKAMKEMQDNNHAMMAVAQLEMRKDHVTRLFLARQCRVSTLALPAVLAARASLEESRGERATPLPVTPVQEGPSNAAEQGSDMTPAPAGPPLGAAQ